MLPYDRRLKERSQRLRKNMTAAETFLWSKIRMKQLKGYWFYRQKPVGNFIADFYCHKAKLVIELDGEIHNQQKEYDLGREAEMEKYGIKIIRFTNDEVFNELNSVIEKIKEHL